MKKLIAIGLVGLALGCCKIPHRDVLREIQAIPQSGNMDCRRKAQQYHNVLRDKGIDSRIAIGGYQGRGHCWVEYNIDGKFRLADPTKKEVCSGFPVNQYNDYESDFFLIEKKGSSFNIQKKVKKR